MPEQPTLKQVSPKGISGGLTGTRPKPLQPSGDPTFARSADSTRPNVINSRRENDLESGQALRSVSSVSRGIHPSWLALIELCRDLGHGEIERLSIQDGLPVLAETVKKKVRFTR